MKQIYLLRHAKSSRDMPELADFDRPLSARGGQACEAMRSLIVSRGIRPQLVLCSAAGRAQETLRNISPGFHHDFMVSVEKRLYLASAAKLLERLRRLDDRIGAIMLIGHNPGLQRLALLLGNGDDRGARARLEAKFPTAALAHFAYPGSRWRDLEVGKARLLSVLEPRLRGAPRDTG